MKKFIFYFLFVLVLICGGILSYVYFKPHRNVSEEDVKFTLSAADLFKEYEADEELANKKYLDMVLEVKGRVSEIVHDQSGNVFVVLKAKQDMVGVSCSIREKDKKKAESLKIGKNLRVKGICSGGGGVMDVVLNKCEILD